MINNKQNKKRNNSISRRKILYAGTAPIILGGLAGCLNSSEEDSTSSEEDPTSSEEDSTSSEEDPTSSEEDSISGYDYTQWIYNPRRNDSSPGPFTYTQPHKIVNNREYFNSDVYEESVPETLYAGVDYGRIKNHLRFDSGDVITGSFEKSELKDLINVDASHREETIGEYNLYLFSDDIAYAINDGVFIYAAYNPAVSDTNPIKLMIESQNKDTSRFADINNDFEELTNKLNAETIAEGAIIERPNPDYSDLLSNVRAGGQSIAVDGEESEFRGVFVYEQEEDVNIDSNQVHEFYTDFYPYINEGDLEISKVGRASIATTKIDTDTIEYLPIEEF